MRLTRRELRRLIESVVNEEQDSSPDRKLYIAVKYIPFEASAHDAEALRDKIIDSGKLNPDQEDSLENAKPGHELNHDNLVALCVIGKLSIQNKGADLMLTNGRTHLKTQRIFSDFDSKGATVVYRTGSGLEEGEIDLEAIKKALNNGLRTIGLRDGIGVSVKFKG